MSDNNILLRFTPVKEMESTIRIIKTRGMPMTIGHTPCVLPVDVYK